jgi:hypothetical protein
LYARYLRTLLPVVITSCGLGARRKNIAQACSVSVWLFAAINHKIGAWKSPIGKIG